MTRVPSGSPGRSALAKAALAASLLLAAVAGFGGCGSDDEPETTGATGFGAFYGVAPEGQQNEADYSRMVAGGVGTVRVVVQWSLVETAEGIYDWDVLDQLMGDLTTAGLEPLATVFGTPPIYADAATDAPTNDEKTFDAWADFLAAAAARYGTSGDFWDDFEDSDPDIEPQPIREWEIWNEPNSSTFWSPTPDPEAYAALVKRSANVLDEVDPEAELMTGGMFVTPQSDGAIVSYDFLAELLGQEGVDDAVDVVGLHPYGPSVDSVSGQVEETRKAVDDAGSDADLWVTEIGWGSDPETGNQLSKTPERQAELLSESFRLLYDSRERWGLRGVVWYTWHDAIEDAVGECGWCATAGLVDADRDTKPAWLAYTELTGGTP